MTTVLRVQNVWGLGPFCSGSTMDACNAAMGVHDHHADMPSAYDEIGVECHWRCGVADARSLVRWFPRPMRRVLAERGYRLHVLDVPEASIRRPPSGGSQLIYDPDAARAVASRPLAATTSTGG